MFIWASARWHLKKFPTTVRNQSASCWNFMTNSPRQQFCTSSPPARLFSQSFCMYGFIFFGACVSFSMRVCVCCVCCSYVQPFFHRSHRAFERFSERQARGPIRFCPILTLVCFVSLHCHRCVVRFSFSLHPMYPCPGVASCPCPYQTK